MFPSGVDVRAPHGLGLDLLLRDDVHAPLIDLRGEPGARLTRQLQVAGQAPGLLSRIEVLDAVEGAEKAIRWLDALRTRMLAEFHSRHPADPVTAPPGADESGQVPSQRWVPTEVGLTLGVSRLEALGQIERARRFTEVLPDTLAELERGRIGVRCADAIARATAVLPDDKAREVEARVLARAHDATLRQVQDRVRRAIARVDPDGEYRRHKEADRGRRVSIRSLEDGMASLWFYGSAAEIEAAWQMADRLARSLGKQDPRTLDQRRFDLSMEILQGRLTVTNRADLETAVSETLATQSVDADEIDETPGADGARNASRSDDSDAGPAGAELATSARTTEPLPGARPAERPPDPARIPTDALADALADALSRRPDLRAAGRKPFVQVVVGIDTLMGSARPGELLGHGPIDADTARTLAADSVIQRLLTDPAAGTVVEHGRKHYAPPAALADHLRSRDQICRGPRCTRRVRDADHHLDWALGGDTDLANLYGYCKHCHLLKDAPGWHSVTDPDDPNGDVVWISPCGRRTTSSPYDYRDFTDDLPDPIVHTSLESAGTGSAKDLDGADDDPPPF